MLLRLEIDIIKLKLMIKIVKENVMKMKNVLKFVKINQEKKQINYKNNFIN